LDDIKSKNVFINVGGPHLTISICRFWVKLNSNSNMMLELDFVLGDWEYDLGW